MSSLYLPIALVGTFGAVAAAAVALQLSAAERRRSVELLEGSLSAPAPDLRVQQLEAPLAARTVSPVLSWLTRTVGKLSPQSMRERIDRKLVLAGGIEGWDAETVAALKIAGGIGGGVLGLALGRIAGAPSALALAGVVFFALVGYLVPGASLSQRAAKRQAAIQRALPDTMDLLTISVEAGLGFDAALSHVVKKVPGPLSDEIGRMLQEMRLGTSRVDALRHLADRTDVDELEAFVLAMVQADVFGVSVSKVLRAQAKESRIKRRQRAEHKAMQTPVKLLFPLIFCILPALFVVVVGPGAIRIVQSFFGISA